MLFYRSAIPLLFGGVATESFTVIPHATSDELLSFLESSRTPYPSIAQCPEHYIQLY